MPIVWNRHGRKLNRSNSFENDKIAFRFKIVEEKTSQIQVRKKKKRISISQKQKTHLHRELQGNVREKSIQPLPFTSVKF